METTMIREDQLDYGSDSRFDIALHNVLQERVTRTVPGGLEQRLRARLAQASDPAAVRPLFTSAEITRSRRSVGSLWTALGIHAGIIAFIAFVVVAKVGILSNAVKPTVSVSDLTMPPPPPTVNAAKTGGGGGQHDLAAASVGRLPKFSPEQILKPAQAPKIEAQLVVEPTINVQTNLKMANNDMTNLGLPSSNLPGASLGNGNGTGVGSGTGSGIGLGSNGNGGGGLFHIGGSILKPELVFGPDPEFSEEARKAKFSGNVEVYLWVDEQGNPSHIKVVRGVGMGLDEKAVEAVRQYKFKPATRNGKPVKVDLYVDVNFNIL